MIRAATSRARYNGTGFSNISKRYLRPCNSISGGICLTRRASTNKGRKLCGIRRETGKFGTRAAPRHPSPAALLFARRIFGVVVDKFRKVAHEYLRPVVGRPTLMGTCPSGNPAMRPSRISVSTRVPLLFTLPPTLCRSSPRFASPLGLRYLPPRLYTVLSVFFA